MKKLLAAAGLGAAVALGSLVGAGTASAENFTICPSGVSGVSTADTSCAFADNVRRACEQAGRDPANLAGAALIYCCVDDDRARAEEVVARYFGHYYAGSRPARGGAIMGPPDDCVRGINEYIQAGVRYPIIGFPSADLGSLDRFLEKVLPRLEV